MISRLREDTTSKDWYLRPDSVLIHLHRINLHYRNYVLKCCHVIFIFFKINHVLPLNFTRRRRGWHYLVRRFFAMRVAYVGSSKASNRRPIVAFVSPAQRRSYFSSTTFRIQDWDTRHVRASNVCVLTNDVWTLWPGI